MEIVLKNYRCFPDTKPARFELAEGMTAFIGVNNVGKSSLLKFFHEFRSIFERQRLDRTQIPLFQPAPSTADVDALFCRTNDRKAVFEVGTPAMLSTGPVQLKLVFESNLGNRQNWNVQLLVNGTHTPFGGGDVTAVSGRGENIAPIFQAARDIEGSVYVGPFRNAINVGGGDAAYFDIVVGQPFIEMWHQFKSGNNVKNNERAGQLVRDIQRIFGLRSLEINTSPDKKTLQLLVNEKSFTLNELGGGISQFIVVLANVLMKRPSYVLIDEPELNLHPQLQLDFLTTIASYATKGVLFSTHSIRLARAAADKIYAVRKTGDFESEVVEYNAIPRLAEFLGELSFSAYKELGFNSVLLVEGVTDVKAFQQFLRRLGKDHEILMLPLGGSALINGSCEEQLFEIKRITPKVSCLIDSERESDAGPLNGDRREFETACRKANIDCHIFQRRALENYFPERVIKEALGETFRALGPYDRLKDSPNPWPKSENWRLAARMNRQELEGCDFWPFLKKL